MSRHYDGDYAHDCELELASPGVALGYDQPLGPDEYGLVLGNPYDGAHLVRGTPEELRAFEQRLAATLDDGLPAAEPPPRSAATSSSTAPTCM